MTFKVNYTWNCFEWNIKPRAEAFEIFSPTFSASPDTTDHHWKVGLKWDPSHPKYSNIFLYLVDETFQKPVSVKFHFDIDYFCKFPTLKERGIDGFYIFSETGGWEFSDIRHYGKLEKILRIRLELEMERKESNTPSSLACTSRNEQRSGTNEHESTKKLQEDFLKLFDSNAFTDISIKCANREFKLHKQILASRSPEFKRIFMNEDQLQLDVDPEVFSVFLKFLYTGKIKIVPETVVDVLDLSRRYKTDDLSRICQTEMVKNMDISTSVKFLISADKYKMEDIRKDILKFMKSHLREIMNTDDWKTFMVDHVHLMADSLASIALDDC